MRACVYLSMSMHNHFSICFQVCTKLSHTTVQTNFAFHQSSSRPRFKMATRPHLSARHPIPWAIAKYTPCEPYTTYFDRPNGRPSCHDCSNSTSSVNEEFAITYFFLNAKSLPYDNPSVVMVKPVLAKLPWYKITKKHKSHHTCHLILLLQRLSRAVARKKI